LKRVLLLLIIFLTACDTGKELVTNIDPQQSVEVIVALNRAGIVSERKQTSSGRNALYTVLVQKTDYAKALEILSEYELPKEKSKELEQLLNTSGLVSSELASIRVNRALSLEIERLLTDLPGVVTAKALVHSANNLNKSLFEEKSKPSASVLIKYFSDQPSKVPFEKETVIEVVTKSIPGITATEISLNLVKIESPTSWLNSKSLSRRLKYVRPFAFRVPEEDLTKAKYQIVGVLLLICFAGFLLGGISFLAWIRRKYKSEAGIMIESSPASDLPIEVDRTNG
jgi:type III secretion system YscJ/HrcJ family lipoprotein